MIEDLELAGFIRRDVSFDPATARNQPRTIRYRISDNYLRFFLKYIQPRAEQIQKGLYRHRPLEALPAWDTLMGLQFESLILSNLGTLLEKTGLADVPLLNAGPYVQAQTQRKAGCQIDLLLRTKQSLYVFEVKFRGRIERSVVAEVRQKIERLKVPRGLSVRAGLIYQGELDPEIADADFFDQLVPFDRLLE